MAEKVQNYFQCLQCSLQFDRKVWYDMHLSLIHECKNEPELNDNNIKQEKERLSIASNIDDIELQNKQTSIKEDIPLAILNSDQERKSFKCTTCYKSFFEKRYLNKHIKFAHGRENVCVITVIKY